jgi:hypothetical protein
MQEPQETNIRTDSKKSFRRTAGGRSLSARGALVGVVLMGPSGKLNCGNALNFRRNMDARLGLFVIEGLQLFRQSTNNDLINLFNDPFSIVVSQLGQQPVQKHFILPHDSL